MKRFEVRTNLGSNEPTMRCAREICEAINHLARLNHYDGDEKCLQALLDDIIEPQNQALLGLSLAEIDALLSLTPRGAKP